MRTGVRLLAVHGRVKNCFKVLLPFNFLGVSLGVPSALRFTRRSRTVSARRLHRAATLLQSFPNDLPSLPSPPPMRPGAVAIGAAALLLWLLAVRLVGSRHLSHSHASGPHIRRPAGWLAMLAVGGVGTLAFGLPLAVLRWAVGATPWNHIALLAHLLAHLLAD
jgi:hypothetical protein